MNLEEKISKAVDNLENNLYSLNWKTNNINQHYTNLDIIEEKLEYVIECLKELKQLLNN